MKKHTKSLPKVGDEIYVGTSLYIGHGADDFQGGLCEVIRIEEGTSGGERTHYVTVKERPSVNYNWKFLAVAQDELRAEFGEARGHADPDYDPEFNTGSL